ncbi:uncharacterized protein LOC133181784 isoform X2 [Saccostrea echinata]|uniref:uncharacterized protein LOC133181784 isoform X2 n=1 Tax=Saccostrea echinata TaxID=191078 RepID=UPI002A836865|nr:uncharacterized protein LOC133181784 isoform X2 [Saccostrea echinata]
MRAGIFFYLVCMSWSFYIFGLSEPIPPVMCPNQYNDQAWLTRALEKCKTSPKNYHCVMVNSPVQAHHPQYKEFCQIPVQVPKGKFVILNKDKHNIEFISCPPERYQPTERMTNQAMIFQCEQEKSQCDGEGQAQCDNGSAEMDRTCRCDYTNGYVLEAVANENPDNITCIHPKLINLECTKFDDCRQNQTLSETYQCVDKCPPGQGHPPGSSQCKDVISIPAPVPSFPSSTTTQPSTPRVPADNDIMKSMKEKDDNKDVIIVIVIVVVIVIGAVISGVIFHIYCNYLQSKGKTSTTTVVNNTHNIYFQQENTQYNVTENKIEEHIDTLIKVDEVGNMAVGGENTITCNINDGSQTDQNNDDEDSEETKLLSTPKQDKGDKNVTPPEVPVEVQVHQDGNMGLESEKGEQSIDKPKESHKETGSGDKDEYDCNEYMKEMKEAAKKKGWLVTDVPKDGSCFYHCVLKLCDSVHDQGVSTLRKKLKKYLEKNSKIYKDFVFETWETFLSGIEANKWADHLEISAMAKMLNIPIVIHKLNNNSNELEVKEEIRPENCHVEAINIGHILVNKEGFHFVALVPLSVVQS